MIAQLKLQARQPQYAGLGTTLGIKLEPAPDRIKTLNFKNDYDTYVEALDFLCDCSNIVDLVFHLHVNVETLGRAHTCP